MSHGDYASSPFIRDLASSQRKTRDHALEMIIEFIRSRRDLTLLEMLKIWKGLFFCFYHSDGPLVQQSLARSLSYSLVPELPDESLQLFLRAFWITMGREWHSLDRYRLDKYMYLIRCYVGVAFEVFVKRGLERRGGEVAGEEVEGKSKAGGKKNKKEAQLQEQRQRRQQQQKKGGQGSKRKHDDDNDDNQEASDKKKNKKKRTDDTTTENDDIESNCWSELDRYLSMLQEGVLSPLNFEPPSTKPQELTPEAKATTMPKGPDGLRYHVLDIWVDEIEKVAAAEETDGDENEEGKVRLKEGIPLQLLLRPISNLKENSITKMVRKRAGETLAESERFL